MDGDQERRLPPMRSKSTLELVGFLMLQVALVPLRRLFATQPIEGWSVGTEIFVKYIRYSMDNDLQSSRKAEENIGRFLNLTTKEKLVPMETDQFRGEYVTCEPQPEDAAILLYFHGGGYSLNRMKTYLPGLLDIRKAFETRTKRSLAIFGLDYSRSPEARYPTQINEAVASYTYIREKFPNHQLFVMGDSAGGNLVLALLTKLKQSQMQQPDGAVLISPWVKMYIELEPDLEERDSDKDMVSAMNLLHQTYRYLPAPITAESVQNPLVSPIYGDFSDACPIFIHYGSYEWMVPDIEEFIDKLKAEHDDVRVVKEAYAPHISPFGAQVFGEMANRGIKSIAEYLAAKLKTPL